MSGNNCVAFGIYSDYGIVLKRTTTKQGEKQTEKTTCFLS